MKKKSKKQDGCFLELNGKISLIERRKGKMKSREVLDGKVMLEALRYMLEKALDEALARQA